MRKVIILGDSRKEGVVDLIEQLKPLLKVHAKIVGEDLTGRMGLENIKADLVLVFGGDGLLLSTARRLGKNQIPVVGINVGKFGFLAELKIEELKTHFQKLLTKSLKVRERMMLDCRIIRNNKQMGNFIALNDAVVTRGTISRMLYVNLLINDKYVTTFKGDGVIISTPVGSTAHSLSSGGPVVHPDLDSFIVTSICPHSLSVRPLVIPPSHSIILEIAKKPEEIVLTVDGQIFMYLHENDKLVVTESQYRFKIVDTGIRTFYDTLVSKLNWKGSLDYAKDRDQK